MDFGGKKRAFLFAFFIISIDAMEAPYTLEELLNDTEKAGTIPQNIFYGLFRRHNLASKDALGNTLLHTIVLKNNLPVARALDSFLAEFYSTTAINDLKKIQNNKKETSYALAKQLKALSLIPYMVGIRNFLEALLDKPEEVNSLAKILNEIFQHYDFNKKDALGNTLLHKTLLKKNLPLARVVISSLEQRYSPNTLRELKKIQNNKEETPLLSALYSRMFDLVPFLADSENVNIGDKQFASPLQIALQEYAPLQTIQKMLEQKADPNTQGDFGITPLMQEVQKQEPDLLIIAKLLEAGARPNSKRAGGESALLIEMKKQQPSISLIKLLLRHKADINSTTETQETTLLRELKKDNPNTYLITLLLNENADPFIDITTLCSLDLILLKSALLRFVKKEYCDPEGKTFMYQLMQKLFSTPLDPSKIIDTEGQQKQQQQEITQPVQEKMKEKIILALEHLINKKNINHQDRFGYTLLNSIIQHNECTHEFVQLLCSKGADTNVANRFGITPLHTMLSLIIRHPQEIPEEIEKRKTQRFRLPINQCLAIIETLLNHGADPEIKTSYMHNGIFHNNKTPLQMAQEAGLNEVVELLSNKKSPRLAEVEK